MNTRPLTVRFWAKVEKTEACWLWTGARGRAGYGHFWSTAARQMTTAHRFAYELLVGPIPPGLQIDHLCRNRRCVRPDHLEPVTTRENTFRSPLTQASINAAKTHCKHGHPFDGANLYYAQGYRACRVCHRAGCRESRLRRLAKAKKGG